MFLPLVAQVPILVVFLVAFIPLPINHIGKTMRIYERTPEEYCDKFLNKTRELPVNEEQGKLMKHF